MALQVIGRLPMHIQAISKDSVPCIARSIDHTNGNRDAELGGWGRGDHRISMYDINPAYEYSTNLDKYAHTPNTTNVT